MYFLILEHRDRANPDPSPPCLPLPPPQTYPPAPRLNAYVNVSYILVLLLLLRFASVNKINTLHQPKHAFVFALVSHVWAFACFC